jgi:hypothetical protein
MYVSINGVFNYILNAMTSKVTPFLYTFILRPTKNVFADRYEQVLNINRYIEIKISDFLMNTSRPGRGNFMTAQDKISPPREYFFKAF